MKPTDPRFVKPGTGSVPETFPVWVRPLTDKGRYTGRFQVRSESDRQTWYTVSYDTAIEAWSCECTAGRFKGVCRHLKQFPEICKPTRADVLGGGKMPERMAERLAKAAETGERVDRDFVAGGYYTVLEPIRVGRRTLPPGTVFVGGTSPEGERLIRAALANWTVRRATVAEIGLERQQQDALSAKELEDAARAKALTDFLQTPTPPLPEAPSRPKYYIPPYTPPSRAQRPWATYNPPPAAPEEPKPIRAMRKRGEV